MSVVLSQLVVSLCDDSRINVNCNVIKTELKVENTGKTQGISSFRYIN